MCLLKWGGGGTFMGSQLRPRAKKALSLGFRVSLLHRQIRIFIFFIIESQCCSLIFIHNSDMFQIIKELLLLFIYYLEGSFFYF